MAGWRSPVFARRPHLRGIERHEPGSGRIVCLYPRLFRPVPRVLVWMDSVLRCQHRLDRDSRRCLQQLPGRSCRSCALDRKTCVGFNDRRHRGGECARNSKEREPAERSHRSEGVSDSGDCWRVALVWQPHAASLRRTRHVAVVPTLGHRLGARQRSLGL